MCGLVGLVTNNQIDENILKSMVDSIRHRGPDDSSYLIEGNVGLGHVRLSILDIENGHQPVLNDDGQYIIFFNGEVYNHKELWSDLHKKGYKINNNSDSAILPYLYEEYGVSMFEKLNGQFAIIIWDKKENKIILARDPFGEKPLYYYHKDQVFCFASEIKAIFKSGYVRMDISPEALSQVFIYWSPLSNQTMFKDIYPVIPGHYLVFKNQTIRDETYWELKFGDIHDPKDQSEYIALLDYKMRNAVKTHLQSDVGFACYLSGGLDSGLITAMALQEIGTDLQTFSLIFDDNQYNEKNYQAFLAKQLGIQNTQTLFSEDQIPEIVRDVVLHTEVPLLRAGVFPMYFLAKQVRSNGYKVILSGEGADELFGGYDIFKQVKVQEFCAKNPTSKYRKLLYKRFNNYISGLNNQNVNSLSFFYNSINMDSPFVSHELRWRAGRYIYQFFSTQMTENLLKTTYLDQLEWMINDDYHKWSGLQKAQFLESNIFLPGYLLSSQGDRVSMAHGVEVRYPFLDKAIVDFAVNLPDKYKIKGLTEKYLLRKLAEKYLPPDIINRTKFPYRSPINPRKLLSDNYVKEMLEPQKINKINVFNSDAINKFLKHLKKKEFFSERDIQIFLGILTTQILIEEFEKIN